MHESLRSVAGAAAAGECVAAHLPRAAPSEPRWAAFSLLASGCRAAKKERTAKGYGVFGDCTLGRKVDGERAQISSVK